FPACAYLTGQYGLNDMYLGVPIKLGRNGVEEVIELKLTEEELALVHSSAEAVQKVTKVLETL
ncbi:MAG: malate dehydrogenase, partial [Bacteroidota bacterium]